MNEVKVTDKMNVAINAVKELGGKAFAREVLAKVEGKTFNGVNATLAAAAGKGYATKVKAMFGEGEDAKMLTRYTITEAGVEVINTPEETEEAPAEDAE